MNIDELKQRLLEGVREGVEFKRRYRSEKLPQIWATGETTDYDRGDRCPLNTAMWVKSPTWSRGTMVPACVRNDVSACVVATADGMADAPLFDMELREFLEDLVRISQLPDTARVEAANTLEHKVEA